MPRPSPDANRLADAFRIGLREMPLRGLAGGRLGKGTGSSLEFQDRRNYAIGDDVRHLDWRTYARTGEMMVKLYREEIAPRVEILVDGSASMSVDAAKSQLVVDLTCLLARCAHEEGYQVTTFVLGTRPSMLNLDRLEGDGFELDGTVPIDRVLPEVRSFLRPGALRLILSDFHFPHDAAELMRPIAARAGGFAALQVLSAEDEKPTEGRALRLTDAETGETIDLVLDATSIRTYLDRASRLRGALEEECRRFGGHFASLTSTTALEDHCRTRLVPLGVLEPA